MADCPNCHQPVAPGDDVCENCGAVLLTVVASQACFVMPAPAPPFPAATLHLCMCPTCQTPVNSGDDICKNGWRMLSEKRTSGDNLSNFSGNTNNRRVIMMVR